MKCRDYIVLPCIVLPCRTMQGLHRLTLNWTRRLARRKFPSVLLCQRLQRYRSAVIVKAVHVTFGPLGVTIDQSQAREETFGPMRKRLFRHLRTTCSNQDFESKWKNSKGYVVYLWLTSHPKVVGSNPSEDRVVIFCSSDVAKLGRTSFMIVGVIVNNNIEDTGQDLTYIT